MLYRPKPPTIDAYQFRVDWEGDFLNWPSWLRGIYFSDGIIPINNSRVIATIGKKAIFVNDYVYITEDGVEVIPEEFFENRYELVA